MVEDDDVIAHEVRLLEKAGPNGVMGLGTHQVAMYRRRVRVLPRLAGAAVVAILLLYALSALL